MMLGKIHLDTTICSITLESTGSLEIGRRSSGQTGLGHLGIGMTIAYLKELGK